MRLPPASLLPDPALVRSTPIRWLLEYADRPENRGALVHWQTLPARPARYSELVPALPDAITAALEARGITRLYTHQVRAVEALRAGRDTVIVTGTASGKSLCFHVPALERMLEAPGATSLHLFPTKALAQDQLKRDRKTTRLNSSHGHIS